MDCNAGTFFSPDDEMQAERDRRSAVRAPTRRARAAYGFTFKDAIPPFIGHAVCDTPEWLNGLSNPVSDSYHPEPQRSTASATSRSCAP